jgi:hypothetical protein
MSIEKGNAAVVSPEQTAERRWTQATRVLVGLTVFACFLVVPEVSRASNVFTALISSVTAIADTVGQINQTQTGINNFNMTVVSPPSQLGSLQKWLTVAQGSYRNWFGTVLNVKIKSASLSSTSNFESALRSGYSGGNGSNIGSAYNSVYGNRLTASTGNAQVTAQADAYDTTAQEGMTLAANSDNASNQLISTASGLQSLAGSTAPGTADQVGAEVQALQLQSYAMQHRLLASMLRQEATKIANQSSKAKAASSAHSTSLQNLLGGNQ